MAVTGKRAQHYALHHFSVELEIEGLVEAIFTEVTGLQAEIEEFTYTEGGVNDMVHHLPVRVKFPHLILKRGMTESGGLWKWYKKTMQGEVDRKNISVFLHGPDGSKVHQWNFQNAFPVKWSGPDLKADGNAVAIESLEIAHNGMEIVK
jgi:phage tail-like protein